jgi:hypothetical protein
MRDAGGGAKAFNNVAFLRSPLPASCILNNGVMVKRYDVTTALSKSQFDSA